jgi:iron(III) transport system substrate-binding protein
MTRPALALALLLLSATAQAQDASGKLVLYTSQPNTDAQQTLDAFKAKNPKVDISFVRDGTPRLMAKLRAEIEAGQPQADVLLIADSVTMEGLKKEGRLLAHDKADLSPIRPAPTTPKSTGSRQNSSPRASPTTPKRRSSPRPGPTF